MNRKEFFETTEKTVLGEREENYGTPYDSFSSIAALWSAYKEVKFTPVDVSMMMALLKISRIKTGTATDDCFVDLAGYSACGCEINSMKPDKNANVEKEKNYEI